MVVILVMDSVFDVEELDPVSVIETVELVCKVLDRVSSDGTTLGDVCFEIVTLVVDDVSNEEV